MKLEHRLLVTGVFALALCANACVQGTVLGGTAGDQGGPGGEGVGGMTGDGAGGFITVPGMGGKAGGGVGGKTGTGGRTTGTGGVIGTGVGGAIVTTGTGGAGLACPAGNVIAATYPIIDDIEVAANGAYGSPCISGFWYTYGSSKTGTVMPTPFMAVAITDRAGSMYAIHSTATGVMGDAATPPNIFAGFGLDFNNKTPLPPPATKGVVDASAFHGLTFYAKGTGTMNLKISTPTNDPDLGCSAMCYDKPYKAIALTGTWTAYTVLWTDLKQDNFGTKETITGANLGGVQFESKAATGTASYDMWIDALKFAP